LTRIIAAVLLLGAVGTVGLIAYASDLTRPSAWLWGAAISIWSLSPYAVAARATRLAGDAHAALATMLAAAVLLSASGVAILASAFIFDLDPQSALVPLFLPAWQLLGLAPFAIAAQWLVRRFHKPL